MTVSSDDLRLILVPKKNNLVNPIVIPLNLEILGTGLRSIYIPHAPDKKQGYSDGMERFSSKKENVNVKFKRIKDDKVFFGIFCSNERKGSLPQLRYL